MKKRAGFVANSSTTAFCMMAITLTNKEVEALLRKRYELDPAASLPKYCDTVEDAVADPVESIQYLFSAPLQVLTGEEYSDQWHIGIDVYKMPPDETHAQFSTRVTQLISAVLPIGDKTASFVVEGWYDG